MSRYIISPGASQKLDEITDCFAKRNIEAGEWFVNAFDQKYGLMQQAMKIELMVLEKLRSLPKGETAGGTGFC